MGTGHQLLPQRRSAGGSWGEASSHLGEDQGKLLVALDSSVDKRARVKNATSQRRGGKVKAVRHQMHPHASPRPAGPLGDGEESQEAVAIPAGHRPGLGHVTGGHQEIRHGRKSPHQTAQRQGKDRGPGRITVHRGLARVT